MAIDQILRKSGLKLWLKRLRKSVLTPKLAKNCTQIPQTDFLLVIKVEKSIMNDSCGNWGQNCGQKPSKQQCFAPKLVENGNKIP